MNTAHRFGLAAALVLLAGLSSVLAAPALPDRIASHWNAAGIPDATMSKAVGLALVPAISAAILVVFAVIPRIDPLRENIAAFRPYYDWFAVALTAYLVAVHGVVLAFNLGYAVDVTVLVLGATAGLFYSLGDLLSHARRNWFVGIRTPWTLGSEEVWDRTHALGGRLFKATAILALVGLLFGRFAIYFLLVPALLSAGMTVVYSYYLFERLERDGD